MKFRSVTSFVSSIVLPSLVAGIGTLAVDVPTSVAVGAKVAISSHEMVATRAIPRTKGETTVLAPGTIENHRFLKSFTLSHGALTLDPFYGPTPVLTSSEETVMWATQGIGGAIEGIGFADVSINSSDTTKLAGPALSTYSHTPALVGLTKSDSEAFCPVILSGAKGYTSVIPISQGWYAVIFPLSPLKSDAVFSASGNVCGRITHNTLAAAYETVSVDWHLEDHPSTGTVIVASVPRCGEITVSGGGGNEYKDVFEYQVEAAILDRPFGTVCSPATNFDEGPNYANPSTIHGFTGPVLSAGPYAGDVMTAKGPRAQPLY
jgi:hypothetical protein